MTMEQTVTSSRSSFSDIPVPLGPIPLFDTHLKFLTESYLAFFQERKRLEEQYLDGLKKLYRKVKSVDAQLDDKGDLSTIRSVWSEVVENVDREAQTRNALCETLSRDAIATLTALKDSQDRTRKRIKEDLKESNLAYNEYADIVLPRLKTKYTKKYAEVEEQKRAAAMPSSISPVPSPSLDQGPVGAATKPAVTAPQPLRALDRRPSGSHHLGGRNRSPSSSGAFSDLAQHGKKQLNNLIGLLDKGGGVKETLTGAREPQALRTVKAKRDADDADRDYRKGVHWLETLRLRRTKILEAGYNSLELFVEEVSVTVKSVLQKYADNLTATSATQQQLASHLSVVIKNISPQRDLAKLKTNIPRSLASAIPDPILYEHGLVGECNDLIFGFTLADYATAKGLSEGDIPKILRICMEEIEKRGLETEGIYRVSGRHAIVQTLQHELERDEKSFTFSSKYDIYAVAALLKLYLRELPEPVFRFSLQDRAHHTQERDYQAANKFPVLRSKIRRLPPVHQAVLKALLEHLAKVAARSEKNKMDAKNLAISFGGVIFGEDEVPKTGDLLSVSAIKDTVMEDLIMNVHILYAQDSHLMEPPQSPPLPPTPADEPTPLITYGSKMTRVSTVPPLRTTPSPPRDFAPPLPLRPVNSIHPGSSRGSPTSPVPRTDKDLPVMFPNEDAIDFVPATPSDHSSVFESFEGGLASDSGRNSVVFPAQSDLRSPSLGTVDDGFSTSATTAESK